MLAAALLVASFASVGTAAPDRRVYLASGDDARLRVVDGTTELAPIDLKPALDPCDVAVERLDGDVRVYVANCGDDSVSIVDPDAGKVVRVVKGFSSGEKYVAVQRDGAHIYVWNDDTLTLSVVDARTGAVTPGPPLTVDGQIRKVGSRIATDGTHVFVAIPNRLVVLTADGKFVTNVPLPTAPFAVAAHPTEPLVYVSFDSPFIMVVATDDLQSPPAKVNLAPRDNYRSRGIDVTPDGLRLLVGIRSPDGVRVYNLENGIPTTTSCVAAWGTGRQPLGVSANADGTLAYVVSDQDQKLLAYFDPRVSAPDRCAFTENAQFGNFTTLTFATGVTAKGRFGTPPVRAAGGDCTGQPAGAICRPARDLCDREETCDGDSDQCPPDELEPATTVCRPSVDVCDRPENCTGSSPACPADLFLPATTECRASAGPCDLAEMCTGAGAACPDDQFQSAATICRPSAGECDLTDFCSGTDAQCGPDEVRPAGACSDDGDDCTEDVCNGTDKSCQHVARSGCRPCTTSAECDDGSPCTTDACEAGFCRFPPGNRGMVCREAAGACDVAETCTGTSTVCPDDGFASAGTVCRQAAGVCDIAERCSGTGPDCPVDAFQSPTTICRAAAGGCDAPETCSGNAPSCPDDRLQPAGTTCRPAQDPCDQAELCDGATVACPPDVSKQDGDACDDGDPTTTSVCSGHQCKAVKVRVDVPPPPPVPDGVSPAAVKIHVDIAVPDTPGPQNASVTVQGVVMCGDLPPALRPKKCGQSALTRVAYQTRMSSVFVPVTPRVQKQLGKRKGRAQGFDVGLGKRGRRAFAVNGQLPVMMSTTIRDRQGETVSAVFDALLARKH